MFDCILDQFNYLSSIGSYFIEWHPNLTAEFGSFYQRFLFETYSFIINCSDGNQRLRLISQLPIDIEYDEKSKLKT